MAKELKDIEAVFVPPSGLTVGVDLLFRRMTVSEGLGRLPEFRVELLRESKKTFIDVKTVLGKTAAIKVRLGADKFRYFHSVVTQFRRGGATGRFDVYHVEMRPWLWYLTLGADCRIFQDLSAVEIIKKVFDDYKSDVKFEDKLTGAFRKRPFTVQYRETDFAFVSRLMEEEGIYYYFRHEQGQHVLLLCNGPAGHAPLAGNDLHWAAGVSDDQLRRDVISEWGMAHALRSLKYAHADFAPEDPTYPIQKEAMRDAAYPKSGDYEVFDYPGGFDDLAMKEGSTSGKNTEAERLAKLRVDAFESAHVIGQGLTPSRDVSAGLTFNFVGHDDRDSYLITAADYEMSYGGYEASREDGGLEYSCRFHAVPKRTRFQPQPVARRPVVHGPQTATVVGPSGTEIHTDKYGRVKVKFHWDRTAKRDDKASCFVRVSSPWASKQFGMVALPRVGDEVVVEFLEGNPDRPLITGAVYNATNMPPYELPAQATVSGIKSQSSKGGDLKTFNELRFDDKKGSEYVWMQAERDFKRLVKNDLMDSIGNNQTIDIKKNNTVNIGESLDLTVGKAVQIKIGADTSTDIAGDLKLNVKAETSVKLEQALELKIGQALALAAGAGVDIDVGQALKIAAGMDMHIKAGLGINLDGGMKISLKAGASFITLGPEGVTIQGPIVKINSGGAAGVASKAKKANPGTPKAPAKVKVNKDPLAK